MSHRRSRLSKKAKTLVATTVALGVTVAQANKKVPPAFAGGSAGTTSPPWP
ncbi:hypothetical protein [Streptomyces sp. NPDC001658]